jgi:hypothetical protein
MPFLFRGIRRDSVTVGHVRQYFWYAIGEIVLIFFGITLALAFDDWSQDRQLRDQQIASLEDLAENLRGNIDSLTSNSQSDLERLEMCRQVNLQVEERSVWRPENGVDFNSCRYWTSPYLQFAAYDSLKARGTDLITDRSVRASIVELYEETYADLVGDIDREQWGFQDGVFYPVWNRHIRTLPDGSAEPSNYNSLLASEEFLNLLYNRSDFLRRSVEQQERTLESTRKVLATIEEELVRQSSN